MSKPDLRPSSQGKKSEQLHIPALDGLRGVAILLVLPTTTSLTSMPVAIYVLHVILLGFISPLKTTLGLPLFALVFYRAVVLRGLAFLAFVRSAFLALETVLPLGNVWLMETPAAVADS